MKFSILLKDGTLMSSRENRYDINDVNNVIEAINKDFELYIEGKYIANGSDAASLIIHFGGGQ